MKSKKVQTAITIVLLLAGILLILGGIKVSEYETVLQKSVRICLECIGIG